MPLTKTFRTGVRFPPPPPPLNPSLKICPPFSNILLIAYMVFIPKKFRVYFRMIKQNPYASIKNVEWLALQSLGVKLGIPTLNFTELMEEESQKLLRDKNELMFWEDDSHWNANGARTTAGLLCKTIQELGCTTPRVH